MKFIQFPESTKVLRRPADMSEDECSALPVFTNGRVCISCWELTYEEYREFVETKKIWLCILSGQTMPPIKLMVTRPPEISERGEA